MLKVKKIAIITISSILGLAAGYGLTAYYAQVIETQIRANVTAEVKALETQISDFQAHQAAAAAKVREYEKAEAAVVSAIRFSNAKVSESQKASMVAILSRIAMNEFSNFEQRELWLVLLGIESRFNVKAKSPSGALGIGQVMPGSAKWYGEQCGLPAISEEDLFDLTINATISACIFNQLLKRTNGSPSMMLLAYNAGEFTKDLARLEKMESINKESASYIAKISRFLEKMRGTNLLKGNK